MDNYNTSIQLLQELRLKVCTVAALSGQTASTSHMILHKDDCVRGDYRQAVSHDHTCRGAMEMS
jgi:hypothetical protein